VCLDINCVCFPKVPKLADGQQNAENQKALPDVVGPKKQVSYKTEIIGGVPIVTQTQVIRAHAHTHTHTKWRIVFTCLHRTAFYMSKNVLDSKKDTTVLNCRRNTFTECDYDRYIYIYIYTLSIPRGTFMIILSFNESKLHILSPTVLVLYLHKTMSWDVLMNCATIMIIHLPFIEQISPNVACSRFTNVNVLLSFVLFNFKLNMDFGLFYKLI